MPQQQWQSFGSRSCTCCHSSSGKALGIEAVPATASADINGVQGLQDFLKEKLPVYWLTAQPAFSQAVAGQLFGRAFFGKPMI